MKVENRYKFNEISKGKREFTNFLTENTVVSEENINQ